MHFPELAKIQKILKVGKDHSDLKGRYTYRKIEDILRTVKPLIPENCLLVLSDVPVDIAGVAFDVSTATWYEGDQSISCNGCSQIGTIAENKGMSSPQHTGSAITYARKAALCALFLLDSGDDPDEIPPMMPAANVPPPPMPGSVPPPPPMPAQIYQR